MHVAVIRCLGQVARAAGNLREELGFGRNAICGADCGSALSSVAELAGAVRRKAEVRGCTEVEGDGAG